VEKGYREVMKTSETDEVKHSDMCAYSRNTAGIRLEFLLRILIL
jgi:hypothetical protein